MGVPGLWKILANSGQPVDLSSLEGKRLAIDISLWLCRVRRDGSRSPHIQMLIDRVSKLLYYKIHPIFVFDGKNVPGLKKQVLNDRAMRRQMSQIQLSGKQKAMFEQFAEQQLNSSDPDVRVAAEQELWQKLVEQNEQNYFELPILPEASLKPNPTNSQSDSEEDDDEAISEAKTASEKSKSESSSDEDCFIDVSDDEDTVQAIYESCKPQQSNQERLEEMNTLLGIDVKPTDSPGHFMIGKKERDLRILSQRADNGIGNISQRINMKSTASQPSWNHNIQSTSQRHDDRNSRKRRSSPIKKEEQMPSPKKSILPLTAGTNEDDWLPESVAKISGDAPSDSIQLKDYFSNLEENYNNSLISDCRKLFSYLGLPYLIANGEAEAQCVELERLGLCDGVVTDDSDAWLFGVQKCYKDMFSRSRNVAEFDASKIRRELGLVRTQFVAIGMLSGGDYCHGFDGIGCIKALQLITQIGDAKSEEESEESGDSSDDLAIKKEESDTESQENTDSYEEGFDRLQRIREWLDSKAKWLAENKTKKVFDEPKVRTQLRKIIENQNEKSRIQEFPNLDVYNAYMRPDVNSSEQNFEWRPIQFDELHKFVWWKIGWSDEDLKAVTHGSYERWNEFVIQNYGQ